MAFAFNIKLVKNIVNQNLNIFYRSMSNKRGLVLGVYSVEGKDDITFTSFAKKYNDSTSGELLKQINIAGPIKSGSSRIFWNVGDYPAVAVSGLGDASTWNALEGINGVKENIRTAAAVGAKALLAEKLTDIEIEDFECAKSAAEGATLGVFKFQCGKTIKKRTPEAQLKLAEGASGADEWNKGFIIGNCQNWARTLMEMPANLMTPTIFAEEVKTKCKEFKNIEIIAHDRKWAEEKRMCSFLSVAKGSDEPPIFLEITYTGNQATANNDKPICLIGKGVTFDSGGISLKPSSKMDEMRGDMGGAANVASTIMALAALKVPVNVKGLIPLCENLPNGRANKPGDIVYAMNGMSICIDNTDAEGRLILCDAICYADEFKPKYILDIATLTGAIITALGNCVSGAYTNDNKLWEYLNKSGCESGDRMWRMPLYKHYTTLMTENTGYDVNNISKVAGGGSCTAAAFLREFVPKDTPWIHIDMAGVMNNCKDQKYIGSTGMTGRPMRTVLDFVCREAGLIK